MLLLVSLNNTQHPLSLSRGNVTDVDAVLIVPNQCLVAGQLIFVKQPLTSDCLAGFLVELVLRMALGLGLNDIRNKQLVDGPRQLTLGDPGQPAHHILLAVLNLSRNNPVFSVYSVLNHLSHTPFPFSSIVMLFLIHFKYNNASFNAV